MEDDTFRFRKSHSFQQQLNAQFQANPRNKSKACSNFLLKLLLVSLFLFVLPLFPSEPPESISHTVFASTWELFRLLIIGIALSYGLFCCRKIPQISPKPQISQPYVANVLHHSSIFDYENENPSGVLQKNTIPSQHYNLSDYRSEPFVLLGRNSCKNFDERPLGLPIRSLRSRVVDSDSNTDVDQECASECGSDQSGKSSYSNSSSIPRSGQDENLEEHVKTSSPLSWKSRSMREDFMAENGNFVQKCEPKQLKSESFRSPTQASRQKNNGFCSLLTESPNMHQHHHPKWIPPVGGSLNMQQQQQQQQQYSMESREQQYSMESRYPGIWEGQDVHNLTPNNKCTRSCFLGGSIPMERGNTWKGDTFGMPFSDFYTQWNNPTNMVGEVPNLDKRNLSWRNPKFNVPSAVAPPSMPDPSNDFDLRFRKYSHENVSLGQSSSLGHMNMGCDKADFFIPSAPAPAPPSMPDPSNDFGLRSRKYSHENVSIGQSSGMENMNMSCDKAGFSMPSAAAPPSMSPPMNDFASMTRKYSHENVSLGQSPNLESGNLGREKTEFFMPLSAASSPSMSVPDKDFASPIKRIRSRKLGRENISLGKSPKLENGTLVREKTDSSIPSIADPPSVSTPEKGFASSFKRSRSRRTSPVTSLKKEEQGSEKDNVENFVEGKDSYAPHFVDPLTVPTRGDDFGSSSTGSSVKDEQRSIPTRWDDDCFVIPSSENNDMGSLDQEDHSHDLADSSEPALSASSSSRRSSEEQALQQVEGEANVMQSASANSSEIEDLGTETDSYKPSTPSPPPQKDFSREISYKPSTPSPPPQLQARRNDIASSVESNSDALGKRSFLSEDDDLGSSPRHERGKALSKASHSRRFSCGSFFDRDLRKSFKDEAKEASKKNNGDQSTKGKCGWDCFNLDVRPPLTKSALKGKSVRTIKPREIPLETNDNKGFLQKPKNNTFEHKQEEIGASLRGKTGERKEEKPGMVVIQIGISEKRSNSNSQKGDKQGNAGTSILVGLNSQQNSKGKATAALSEVKEEETDNDEIDRKAGEFIAKFKEQIRLQKVASRAESSRQQHSRQSSLLYS